LVFGEIEQCSVLFLERQGGGNKKKLHA